MTRSDPRRGPVTGGGTVARSPMGGTRAVTLRIRNLQVDVPAAEFDRAVTFWSAALSSSARPTSGPYTHLVDVPGPVGVHLQRLVDGPAGYHLDLEAREPDREIARLVELGAERTGAGDDGEVLLDPAGLPFCVCPWGQVEEQLHARTGDAVGVEFVVLDVASEVQDATARFWASALRAVDHQPREPVEMFRYLSGFDGPGGPFAMLVQDVGSGAPARVHVDLHVDTPGGRDAEVARLQELGARDAGGAQHWTTLVAPGGHLLCVVPDHRDDASPG